MIKLSRIAKDHRDAGALHALVGVKAAVDDRTFLTKGGDLVTVLGAQGVDAECLDPAQVDQVARRFDAAARIFDENFRLYQYLFKRDHAPLPHGSYDHPLVQQAVACRARHLAEKAERLCALDTFFAVAYEGWAQSLASQEALGASLRRPIAWAAARLSSKRKLAVLEADLDRAADLLANKAANFVVQLKDVLSMEVLGKHEAYRFLRRLLNLASYKTDGVRLHYDGFVDFQACDSALECYPDHLRLDGCCVQVLTLKEPPAQTFAHMLKALQEIPSHFILASEWKRESNAAIRRLIQSKRRHFHNSKTSILNYLNASQGPPRDVLIDESAAAIVADLGECLEAIEVGGHHFGRFSLTVILYDEDRARLRRSVAECFKVFAAYDAQLIEERYNLLNAYLAVLPGNHAFNLRSMWLLNTHYADLAFVFAPHGGEVRNEHLGAEYLAVLETNHGTPYFLNLHCQDTAHTLVLGATGSGKSFLLNFLITHLQKYEPFTYVFDLGRSYETLTRLFRGAFVPVGGAASGLAINPFCLPPTAENFQFLFSFVRVLAESSGGAISARDERDLFEQIENLYAIEPGQRRLKTLAHIVNRDLRARLLKWVEGGQYGRLFDRAEDTLTFARFQTFDFEGMDKVPEVLEPLLFYILHRANAAIYDAGLATTFKVFVLDEAWRFFRHPTIKQYIMEALKTWRKKNAAMILATQSTDDLLRSEMLPVVVESCPTKIFLANPGLDRQAYRELFHLNDTEAELIATLRPKRQMLLKRPDRAKVLNLSVDPKGYWLYTNDPYDNQKKTEAFERYGFEEGLEILARSNPS